MITRRRSKAASAASTSLQLAKTARVFASSSELERKRKAEQSIADQIAALREIVLQLIKGQEEQKRQTEEQKVLYERQAAELGAVNKALREETEKHSRIITLLEALSEKSVRTPTYSEAAKTGL
jgi:predicted RNA-binding Zn ribbon-like protein